ncbi:MAG: hypothetical protein FWG49_00390 [Leptospirales bacterium]|nr:hypothetical protein [Leptospirales bacterium]
MKKLFLIGLALSMGAVFTLTSCGEKKLGGTVEGETYTTEKWVDENTYQIAASGVSNSKLSNKIQRRESAKRAAILNAQYQVLEKFKGSTIEGAAGMSDFESTGIAIAQEVSGYVKGGSVKKATYDEEDNCEIIYEVKAKGLKKKVEAASWK